jgi:hypothetical protein
MAGEGKLDGLPEIVRLPTKGADRPN